MNYLSLKQTVLHAGGVTEETERVYLRAAFNKVMRISAAVFAGAFICAAIVEWIRSAYAPFPGIAPELKWVPNMRNFLYLMAMFNIFLIRYVVMRIYTSPGDDSFRTVVRRLSRAGVASMLTSGIPCIFGLVLFLTAGDLVDFYLLFGLSIIYSMIYLPRFRNWVSIVEEKSGPP